MTFALPDAGCDVRIAVERGVLHHRITELPADHADAADVVCTREDLVRLAFASDDSLADYARRYPSLARLIEFLDSFDEWFPIVTRPVRALAGRDRRSA